MTPEFIPYEEALALKELGFDEQCFAEYRQWDGCTPYLAVYQDGSPEDTSSFTTECLAPLYQQAFRWFRETQEYEGFIEPSIKENFYDWVICNDGDRVKECDQAYISYEEAELECLKQLIKIVKEKK